MSTSNAIRWVVAAILLFLCLATVQLSAYAATVSGVVYEARTGKSLSGVRLQLFYDAADPSEPGELVPADRLAAGQQGQKSTTDGSYVFDMPEGRFYRIAITSNSDRLSFPSNVIRPQNGFPRSGPVSGDDRPRNVGPRPFFVRFDTNINNGQFPNNHIALDESSDRSSLEFRTDATSVSLGDTLRFSSVLKNDSERAWSASDGSEVYLQLVLARGMRINLASANVRVVEGGITPVARFAPGRREAPGSDRLIRFGPFDVPVGSTLKLQFQVSIGLNTVAGRYESRLEAMDAGGAALSPVARATVAITPDRELSTSTLLGRVFCDKDGNGRQGKHESGVFGAKVYSDTGAIAVSDTSGRFHFTRIHAGSHVFKLDTGTLAGGSAYGSDKRLLRLSEGLPAQLSFPVHCQRKWVGAKYATIVYPLIALKDKQKAMTAATKEPVSSEKAPQKGQVDTAGANEQDDSEKSQSRLSTWMVVGDLNSNTLAVDFDQMPAGLWSIDTQIATSGALPTPEIDIRGIEEAGGLAVPLEFHHVVADAMKVLRWQFSIADESGMVVYTNGNEGGPVDVQWNGTTQGRFILKPETRYQYWLQVDAGHASATSAPRWFSVSPTKSAQWVKKEGRFFGKSGVVKASLRNTLSKFSVQRNRVQGETFSVNVQVSGDQAHADVVRAKLGRYLTKLGIGASSYELHVDVGSEGKDKISIVLNQVIVKATVGVSINGRAVATQNGVFDESIELIDGQELIVEMASASGVKLKYRVRRTPEEKREQSEPNPDDYSETTDVLASKTPAETLRVKLPKKGVVLGDPQLAVSGKVDVGTTLKINGEAVALDRDGAFHVIVILPFGKSRLKVRAEDALGGSSTIRWPVRVAKTRTVALGQLEGIIASSITSGGWSSVGASVPGMTQNSTLQIGPVLLGLRAQGYVKSRFSGGAFSDTVEITAHIDSGTDGRQAFFEQLIDENHSTELFGDGAEEIQDVNTRGKIYARVVAGDSSAAVGSIHTRLEGGELFRYQRTTDGAVAEVRRTYQDTDFSVRAFSTTGNLQSSRDTNWFRATGGTLFYLRHAHVIEGSETLKVVIRARDSGMRLSEEELTEGLDYVVEYQSGRIRLTHPLSMASRSSWVLDNMDSSTTPMSGNLVYLSVQYEHQDQTGTSESAKGGYASTTIENRLSIGAGVVEEQRGSASPYRLLGADVSYNLGEHSNIRAEVGGSKQTDASHFLSTDGGLSFGLLQTDSSFNAGASDSYRVGWKVSADLAAKDWSDASEFSDTNISVYLQDIDQGFASEDAVLDQGRFKFGGRLQHRLSSRDILLFRHEGQVALLPRVGPTLVDVMANPRPDEFDERATYLTSLQWARDVDRLHYKVEAMYQHLSSTASLANGSASVDANRIGVGGQTAYEFSQRTTLHLGQQFVAISGVADPVLNPIAAALSSQREANPLAGVVSNVGGEFQLAPELSLGLDLFQRWNGDNAARLGFRTALSEHGSMYLQEQVGGVGGRLSNVTIVGAEDRFGDDNGGRTYGEYQVDRGVLGNRNRAVMGLGRKWQVSNSLGLGLGFEAQQAYGGHLPDGSAIGNARRHVIHSSLSLQPNSAFRLAAQVELRLDHGDSGSQIDRGVLGADPRDGLPSETYSDHGGVAPGAALVILPGEQIQVVAGVVADWRFNEMHTLLARTRSSISTHQQPGGARTGTARFAELTGGWAFRPRRDDRFEVLSRYSYLLDERPAGIADSSEEGDISRNSHVFAILPFARLPLRFLLSGKLAFKQTEMIESLERGGKVLTHSSAVLAILRLGYQFYGNWDASVELRQLSLFGSATAESKVGSLVEVGYGLGKNLHIGAGYNLSHFSDNELADLQRDSHGVFLRLTGYY